MYYFFNAAKDTTINSQSPTLNYGLDEILELRKMWYGNILDISRILIKFDETELSEYLSKNNYTLAESILILKETESFNIPTEYTITAHSVSGSWDMGIGTTVSNSESSSWIFRNQEKHLWHSGSVYSSDVTGSLNGRGGVYYTLNEAAQSFEYSTFDINMDVTDITLDWLSGSYPNDGFLIKFETDNEDDTNDYGTLKFYSKETNTIYQPKLRIAIDDSQFDSGSMIPVLDDNIRIIISNFKKDYRINNLYRFKLKITPQYFVKSFGVDDDLICLTETSYFKIYDTTTDNVIIPYSEYSKISCNGIENYFDVDFSNWEPGRYYSIEFMVVVGHNKYYFDADYVFMLK